MSRSSEQRFNTSQIALMYNTRNQTAVTLWVLDIDNYCKYIKKTM